MLPIKSVLDIVSNVDLIDYLVSVLLQRRSEDYNLIVLSHSLDELHAARSHQEEAIVLILNVVDKSLVEIEHEAVTIGLLWG